MNTIITRLLSICVLVTGLWGHEVAARSMAVSAGGHPFTISTTQAQDKVMRGTEGRVGVALHLNGSDVRIKVKGEVQPVDLAVVLDRSGSMNGQKIEDARMAVLHLLDILSPRDRISLVTYSDYVETISPLVSMNHANRVWLKGQVRRIRPNGGTNLGSGLQQGISTLAGSRNLNRQRRVILISDGLANKGIVSPRRLGGIAASATEKNMAISTVGVGYDFNELLMTTIADHGSGNYYFLEDPSAFASVFVEEFESARNIVASGLEIIIPLKNGVELIDAGGFPITRRGNTAIIRPGDLRSGQKRKLFLTFRFPTNQQQTMDLDQIYTSYLYEGERRHLHDNGTINVTCVDDREEVVSSIDGSVWSEQVVKEEYGRLKDQVADSIRKGEKGEALKKISEYEAKNRSLNETVASQEVAKNLDEDVQDLKESVSSTFSGSPSSVVQKQKQKAKALQYESYRSRRDKK